MKKITLFCLICCTVIGYGQNLQWAKSVGSTSSERARSIVLDASKNSYITGEFSGTVDFDPGPGVYNLTAGSGIGHVFIQKLDSMGNFVWAKSFGGIYVSPLGLCIKLDGSGNMYISGVFQTTMDMDPGAGVFNVTSNGATDTFILKLDALGNFVWGKSVGGIGFDNGSNVNVDPTGNVYVSGGFQDVVDFDPGPGTYTLSATGTYSTAPGDQHAYILKLDAAGNFLWAQTIANGGGGYTPIRSTAIDASGNVYACGNFSGTADFDMGPGTYTLTSCSGGGQSSTFVTKLSSNGNFNWAIASRITTSQGNGITLDPLGNAYVTGQYASNIDFGPGTPTLTSNGSYDTFILKVDASGNVVWAKSVGGASGYEEGFAITADAAGNSYTTGYFSDVSDFDPGAGIYNLSTAASAQNAFILKLNSAGDFVWANSIASNVNEWGYDIKTDNQNNVYSCGYYQGTADFDPSAATYNLTSNGLTDFYVQKLSQNVCSNMALSVSSASNISCTANGQAIVSVTNGNPAYTYTWTSSPVSHTTSASFTNPGVYSVTVADALGCMRTSAVLIGAPSNLSGFDLDANLVASNYIPGTVSTMNIDAFNDGCVPTSGKLKLVLDLTQQVFNFSIPAPSAVSGDSIIWNFTNMTYNTAHLMPMISVSTKSTAVLGDTICVKLIITPTLNDVDPTNNVKNYCFRVLSSYDPNDKKVYPPGQCANHEILNNQLLTYTIRFQNTGTSNAINIMVKDSLDGDLDMSTIRIVGKSHPVVTEVAGRNLKFHFNNINLADATSNEPQSHGYVIFEAKPLAALPNNTVIKNSVGIYFDFNAPVLTNTVSNMVVSSISCNVATGLAKTTTGSVFQVYPNPAHDKLFIHVMDKGSSLISISDVLGKEVVSLSANEQLTEVNLESLKEGIYFVKVTQQGNTTIQKIVISK